MQLVDGPRHNPGVCIACKGGVDRRCVDTLQKVGNWRVYVCSQCVAEMAGLFGFGSADTLASAAAERNQLRQEVLHLTGAVAAAETARDEALDERVRVVPVEEIVPYIKKLPGRPRADGTDSQDTHTNSPSAA